MCRKCAKMCRRRKTEKSHEKSYGFSWDFGALVGTRIPGPLIKRDFPGNIRQFLSTRRFAIFNLSSSFYHRHPLHCLHFMSCLASIIQAFRCAKCVQKCAERLYGQIVHWFFGRGQGTQNGRPSRYMAWRAAAVLFFDEPVNAILRGFYHAQLTELSQRCRSCSQLDPKNISHIA